MKNHEQVTDFAHFSIEHTIIFVSIMMKIIWNWQNIVQLCLIHHICKYFCFTIDNNASNGFLLRLNISEMLCISHKIMIEIVAYRCNLPYKDLNPLFLTFLISFHLFLYIEKYWTCLRGLIPSLWSTYGRVSSFDHWVSFGFRRPLIGVYF